MSYIKTFPMNLAVDLTCICMHVYVCMYVSVYVQVYVYMYVNMYV